ncbi:hypothetical protein [Mesorhizobium sp. WSM2239]|uniref:Uncharacterized protein n=2 Tax=unclassified Mesorhizobium TaxID=325217 RepID=A0AAU8DCH8_9HYPH
MRDTALEPELPGRVASATLLNLVHASGLFLIGAGTVKRYRDADLPAEQPGREMGVRYVLQGAVQRAGQHTRPVPDFS